MKQAAKSALRADDLESMGNGEFAFSRADFERISQMIYADAGIYMTDAKSALVYARLAKRLRHLRLNAFRDYCDLISKPEGAEERQEMLTALTTNVTKFFREPHHFTHMVEQMLPSFLSPSSRAARIRIWSAACSTGQEPYSIAMSILSAWPDAAKRDLKILATDIDRNVLATAQAGVYDPSLLENVSAEHRRKFFGPAPGGGSAMLISDELRRLITFRQLNLLDPWPMQGQFHAIFCRNVVIYFDEPTQQSLWERFAPRLAPGGALYIGHSERVTGRAAGLLHPDGVSTYRPGRA